jgi:MFS family permease
MVMSSSFRALRSRNYRLWATGTVVSNTGTWMQRTAQDWLVLIILTRHSAFAVGVVTGLQFAPLIAFSAHAGLIADQYSKRRVLAVTQSVMGLSALVLGTLTVTHTVRLWHVFACALLLGIASAVDNPARQAFVSEVVPRADVTSAVSLNSASLNVGRLIGPGVAGLVIAAAGTGPAILINAGSFAGVLVALARMRPGEMYASNRARRRKGQVREGLSYVRHRPDLVLVFAMTGVVSMFGLNFQLTNALMATGPFGKGPREYGLLGSVMAIGSLAGAVLAARRERPRLALLVAAGIAFGCLLTLAGVMPTYAAYAVLLVPIGLCTVTFLNSCNTAVQLSTAPALRGRVIALYVVVQQGTTPIGSPIVGWIGGVAGARWSVLSGGIAALAACLGGLLVLRRAPGISRRFAAALASADEPAPPRAAGVAGDVTADGASGVRSP